ncbi:hypothetical protein [Mucilaginibacter rubeus]|uniref:Uncharacterized protein n=1 Tax=Mucilaginibacter rubeus TaxID=2027860 RepID=A0A5C1HY37_9SPHI|nr:hypothetical protein [Mucilaginibacter rubeus]QEM10595.1 hypothetical protein DEO27_011380 [Mucilaginibacter rubeus]
MAQIPPIEDAYIDDVINASSGYNPLLKKTQGVKLRELVKLLRDRLEQEADDLSTGKVDKLTGYQLSQENFTFEEKNKLAVLREHFRGYFISLETLQSSVPTGVAGDYAFVDQGPTTDAQMYIWNTDNNQWAASAGGQNLLDTVLAGINFNVTVPVVSTDNVLTAFGKLQGQINHILESQTGGSKGQLLAKASDENFDYEWITPSNDSTALKPAISHTYAELKALVDSENLVPGQLYVVTDYATQYLQPVSNAVKKDAAIEPLLITAISKTGFASEAISPEHPDDKIAYDFTRNILKPGYAGDFHVHFQQTEDIPGLDGSAGKRIIVDIQAQYSSLNGGYELHASAADTQISEDDFYRHANYPFVNVVVYSLIEAGGQYDGPDFKIKINGTNFTIQAAQVPVVNYDEVLTGGLVLQQNITGNCAVQVYLNTEPAEPVLTPAGPATPAITRPGWITRRVDDHNNDAPYDHRKVLTWGEVTHGSYGYSQFKVFAEQQSSENTNDYSQVNIVIRSFRANLLKAPIVQPYPTEAWIYKNFSDFGFEVYAVGKCDVESYCLVNGVSYTIPPFDNTEAVTASELHSGFASLAPGTGGNVIVQFYPDADNVPAPYILDQDMQNPVPAIMGEVPTFGQNCFENYIAGNTNVNAADIPQIALGDNCSHNLINENSNLVFLPAYSSRNTITNSRVSPLTDNGGERALLRNVIIDSQVSAATLGNTTIIQSSILYIDGANNDIYNSQLSIIVGSFNKLLSSSDFTYTNGDNNVVGSTRGTGGEFGFVIGSGNIRPGFVEYSCIRGNNNVFPTISSIYNSSGNFVVGDYNNIGDTNIRVFGNNNTIVARPGILGGLIEADNNVITGSCSGLFNIGKGSDNNRFENINALTYGKNCKNNYEISGTNIVREDGYSDHKPWNTTTTNTD